MAFWGVEVKPGKPVIHSCEKARGRLRISQATLGISDATKKSIVQCNLGKKSPVLLCALLPNQTESCHLDLEFEEADDVVFSVIGPRSVYLTGYYVRQSQQSSPHSDSESYGVDIQDSEREESSCRSDDDEYEDSFIDDDDEPQNFSPSPVSRSKVADETASENDSPNKTKGHRRRLKKNRQVVESDDASSHHSEDEDNDNPNNGKGHHRRLKKNGQVVESNEASSHHSEEENDNPNNGKGQRRQFKKNHQVIESDEASSHHSEEENDNPNNGKGQRRQFKKNHQVIESDDASSHHSEDEDGYLLSIFKSKRTGKTTSAGNVNQNVTTNNGKDQMHSLDRTKPKKKRKERSQQEKTCEVEINEGRREDKINELEASKNLGIEVHQSVTSPELDSGKCRKSKKRRKQLQLEGTFTEEIDVRSKNVAKDYNLEHRLLHADDKKEVQVANGDQEQQIDNDVSTKSGLLDNASKIEKKIKKKTNKKKNQSNGESVMVVPDTACNQETTPMKSENLTPNAEPTQNRTLSNGLIIEEVANGPSDGKVASRGKKVKIFYTAMLKENGHIYDSNVGKSPYKFRLGNEGVIEGWNLGIDGMHVGDKRRLIVPPSMGSGKHGTGENVPPDSWLVYDVELAGVYK